MDYSRCSGGGGMNIYQKMKPLWRLTLMSSSLLALALTGCVTYIGPRSNFMVSKEAMYVSCPDAENQVEVSGSIGFREYTPQAVSYEIKNKNLGMTVTGFLKPGNPFKDKIFARVNDKIKVTFKDDRGKSKSKTLEVPAMSR